jgi:hypothetical protein
MGKNQGPHEGLLAAVYIDGFNLYHPIHEFGEPFLKWINLWRLSELMCERHDTRLVKVVFCTAVQDDEGKRDRHNTYNAALRAMGVTVQLRSASARVGIGGGAVLTKSIQQKANVTDGHSRGRPLVIHSKSS